MHFIQFFKFFFGAIWYFQSLSTKLRERKFFCSTLVRFLVLTFPSVHFTSLCYCFFGTLILYCTLFEHLATFVTVPFILNYKSWRLKDTILLSMVPSQTLPDQDLSVQTHLYLIDSNKLFADNDVTTLVLKVWCHHLCLIAANHCFSNSLYILIWGFLYETYCSV